MSSLVSTVTKVNFDDKGEKEEPIYLKTAVLILEADQDILAYKAFPKEYWGRIHAINLVERINKKIRRRTKVIGVFPNIHH